MSAEGTNMSIDIQTFADRFNRVRAELEAAIGDRKIAELATLSLVTGLPLLIDSSASQKPLAEAIQGCVKGAVLNGTSSFQKIDEIFFANIRESNVYWAGDIDEVAARASAFVMAHLSEITGAKMFVVVANSSKLAASPRSALAPEAFRNTFGFSVKSDITTIGTTKPVITRDEVVEMRTFLDEDHIQSTDTLLEYIVNCWNAARNEDDVVPEELAQYIDLGPHPRANIQLHAASKALAAANSRTFVTPDDVRALLEPVYTHRILPCSVSPYSIAGLGKRVVKEVLDRVPVVSPKAPAGDTADEKDTIF